MSDAPEQSGRQKKRAPVGERLAASRRLVVLGDPGGGKTTMLRWMATAYLLRQKGDAAFSQLPDTQTLPNQPLIPVLIRCRDLGEVDLCRCFVDFLTQHLNKTELLPDEAEVMRAVILDRVAKGKALLLVDGLDEITNPHVRMMFCQELEHTAARYPDAPIVVTSRIVGYRDMPYRMGSAFEHGQIAELNREDKDLFARRWVEVTEQHQSADEKAKRAKELLDALHSNDRVERLTGNPMLLTTLALVKRKVGKLPNKRTKLYAEAVSVLLNWNPRLYQTIEEDEAIPQLEFIAYEMCRLGVQRLADDEILDLLDKLRVEYPNIRAVKRREPDIFLNHLEERSSILIKSGGIWQKNTNQEMPVWEFRHLTFQEYLAARALLDGRYPGRDKNRSLAEQVAPLAGAVLKAKARSAAPESEQEFQVPESWREALRLLVADCKDDDVDEVLSAILQPMAAEDTKKTGRPRATLAGLCVADEPNVSEEIVERVLIRFAREVSDLDGAGGSEKSVLDLAAMEIGRSAWSGILKKCLLAEAVARPTQSFARPLAVWADVEVSRWAESSSGRELLVHEIMQRCASPDTGEALCAIIVLMSAAYQNKAVVVPGLTTLLIDLLTRDPKFFYASAWALSWLNGGYRSDTDTRLWRPDTQEISRIVNAFANTQSTDGVPLRFLTYIFGRSANGQVIQPLLSKLGQTDDVRRAVIEALVQLGDKQAVAPLLAKLDDPDEDVRRAVIEALRQLGGKQAVAPLLAKLDDPGEDVRRAVIEALGQLGDKQAVAPLLAKLDDPDEDVRATAAVALEALGESKGKEALTRLLASDDAEARQAAVRAYARRRDVLDRRLLSLDLDAVDPWLDPQQPVTEAQAASTAARLNITPEQVRSCYEAMAVDLKLKLSWAT